MNNIEKLIKLVKENPNLPIIPMVESEVVAENTYSRWMASFGDCRVGDFYVGEERVYTNKEDLVVDLVYSNLELDDEIWQKCRKRANKLMKKAIIVNIDLPTV